MQPSSCQGPRKLHALPPPKLRTAAISCVANRTVLSIKPISMCNAVGSWHEDVELQSEPAWPPGGWIIWELLKYYEIDTVYASKHFAFLDVDWYMGDIAHLSVRGHRFAAGIPNKCWYLTMPFQGALGDPDLATPSPKPQNPSGLSCSCCYSDPLEQYGELYRSYYRIP